MKFVSIAAALAVMSMSASVAVAQTITLSPGATIDNSTTTNNQGGVGLGGAGGVGNAGIITGGTATVGPITTNDTNIVAPITTVNPTISPTIDTNVVTTDNNLNLQGQQQQQGQVAFGGSSDQSQSLTDSSVHTASAQSGDSAASSNSGGNSFRGGDFTFNEAKQRLQAPAMGSTVVINTADCTRGSSLSISVPGGGASLGHSRGNERCEDREDAKILLALGEREAAVLVMSGMDVNAAITEARRRSAD